MMTPENAQEMLRMLCPVGGVRPVVPPVVERARAVAALYQHLKADGGYVPAWLAREVATLG